MKQVVNDALRRALTTPSPHRETFRVAFLAPGPRHLDIALDLLNGMGTAGNLTSDVQLAALAIEHNADLCSNDNDFGRFPALRWVNPLT
jgi:predicted nucleic acid-binding protein